MCPKPGSRIRRCRLPFLCALTLCALAVVAPAAAAEIGALQSQVDDARNQAGALAGDLEAKQAQLVAAQQQAAAAAARERQLSALLAVGEQRAAELGRRVEGARQRLAVEKARLRRARAALAARLVEIYKSGVPDATALVLGSDGFDDLLTRTDYLRMIEDSDTRLADRVEQVRDAVAFQLGVVEKLKARQDAYNARIAAARSQISAVRAQAESEAAQLAAIRAARAASLNELRSNISGWMDEIERAQQVSAQQAQETVGEWLGGPYSIPMAIVMCESGGNYGAVNPSSGAGGAYQILPSTWGLYGGSGSPQNGSKEEQDTVAGQIWADSGPGAWVCAG
ncbi:MAG: transglycosylase family protein [Actinomycetota bacterium]